jgi:hypothetical protein
MPRAGEVGLSDGKCYPTDAAGVPITGRPEIDAGNRARWAILDELCRDDSPGSIVRTR